MACGICGCASGWPGTGCGGREKIMYIGGSDVLPAPLSREEEGELIARLAEGDQAASSTLIEHNLRLVVYIARRFENTGDQH